MDSAPGNIETPGNAETPVNVEAVGSIELFGSDELFGNVEHQLDERSIRSLTGTSWCSNLPGLCSGEYRDPGKR